MAMTHDTVLPDDEAVLDSCAREPIHIPGSIQPHGVLFALDPEEISVVRVSANVETRFSKPVERVLGRSLEDLLGEEGRLLTDDLRSRLPESGSSHLRAMSVDGVLFNAIAHRSGDRVILELESAREEEAGTLDTLYPLIRSFVDTLQQTQTIEDLTQSAAGFVRQLTGFDRVLIYRFDADWNGTVVAEDRNEALPAYLDLRFPASDIPAQARDLYRLNRLRIIPDADYEPVPIVAAGSASDAADPLDLSFSVLRSVSPVHVEYMKNMRTPASMSISVVDEGRLWGLISCHNATPRQVPVHVRTACDFLGQIVAMQLSAKARSSDAAERVARHAIQSALLSFMAYEDPYIRGLTHHPDELLALADAGGAAVILDGECTLLGNTPGEEEVLALVDWLVATQSHDEVFVTECLVEHLSAAAAFSDTASGVLAISISQLHPSYVLWFRPEVVQTVRWSGDPRKSIDRSSGAARLHPRLSFEMWKETVRDRSLPWSLAQVDTAASLRNAIIGIVMRKAEELAQLTGELKRSNKELEAFSYSVSHDLRAPFRHIVGYAELLKERDALKDDERGQRYVDTIIESAYSAGQLVDGLLGFSQMGRTRLMPMKVDMDQLVDEVRRMLRPDYDQRDIAWKIGKLVPAWGDPAMLRQVMQNLIANAIKYSRSRDHAVIEVASAEGRGETIYSVRDNGVGFEMAYVDKLFGVFQRLHRMEDFEGTGIGLANVRRIMERHGGRAWAEGKVNVGATFYFALPHQTEGD